MDDFKSKAEHTIRYTFEPILLSDLERVFELESIGFPPDEAASIESIRFRYSVAPDLFIGAYDDQNTKRLVGFINATRSSNETLDHDSLTKHDDYGNVILLHSIAIDPSHRRRSVAKNLLKHYIKTCEQAGESAIILACHEELMPLYLGVEFEDRGNSRFVHGSRPWREMRIKFGSRPTNPQELLCPVERCRCVILKGGVGKLISRMKCPLPRTDQTAEKSYTSCWLVNRPTSFENVGFSKPIEQQNNQESQEFRPIQTRWLSCGACDFGPIGWTESSGDLAKQFIKDPEGSFSNVSFLIDCQRVYTIKS